MAARRQVAGLSPHQARVGRSVSAPGGRARAIDVRPRGRLGCAESLAGRLSSAGAACVVSWAGQKVHMCPGGFTPTLLGPFRAVCDQRKHEAACHRPAAGQKLSCKRLQLTASVARHCIALQKSNLAQTAHRSMSACQLTA